MTTRSMDVVAGAIEASPRYLTATRDSDMGALASAVKTAVVDLVPTMMLAKGWDTPSGRPEKKIDAGLFGAFATVIRTRACPPGLSSTRAGSTWIASP